MVVFSLLVYVCLFVIASVVSLNPYHIGITRDEHPGKAIELIYYSTKLSWNDARRTCIDAGGDLAQMTSLHDVISFTEAFYQQFGLSSNFGPSYWVGLYQLSEESFTWAATCQTATTNSLENYDTDIWQPGNHCFRHRPGNAHRGETAPCSIQFPFLCQKYLDAIFSSLMDACYVLDGTPGGNAYMTLISKQCLKVSLNESTVQYSSPDFSDIPNTSCIEATTVVPTQSSTLSITPTSAFPTCACEMTSQQSQHGYSTGQVMTSTSSCTLTSYVISMLPISSV
ncbi:hypothetical protein MAR_016173, partial [Mya arenaria]